MENTNAFDGDEIVIRDKTNTGYVALGYFGENNFIWSNFKQQLFAVDGNKLKKHNLINMLGNAFIVANYTDSNDKGAEFVNYDRLASEIVNKCAEKGIYNFDMQKGAGVWSTKDNELIINSSKVWSTGEFNGSRIQKDGVYVYSKCLGLTKNTDIATQQDVNTAYALIKSFNWERGEQDAKLFFGYILHCYLTGAINWRSHAYVSGEGGSGKSTLQSITHKLLGKNAILIDGQSSEAGIRQKIKNDACAILIDESEASERKMLNILNMFRSASSGSTVLKGTSDQNGTDFTLRFSGLLTGIIPVTFNQADNGRFLKLTLQPFDRNSTANSDLKLLMTDYETLNELGKRLQMLMISKFKNLLNINKIVRRELTKNSSERYADTFGILLSTSYIAFNDSEDEQNIIDYVNSFDFDDEKERATHKDHDEMLENILDKTIQDENGVKATVIDVIYMAYYAFKKERNIVDFKTYNAALGNYGIRVLDEDTLNLLIDTSRSSLRSLLRGTRFETGDVAQVLKRVKNTKVISEPKSIGGVQKRNCIRIELDSSKYNFNKYVELIKLK